MTDEIPDEDVKAAFDDLQSASQGLDTSAARRQVEDQAAGSGWIRLLPIGIVVAVVGVVGLSVVLTDEEGPESIATDEVEAADSADGAPSHGLVGTSWVLSEGAPIVNGWPITIGFEADTFGGTAACNGFGGSYTVDGSQLVIGGLSQNSAGCEERVLKSEEVFMAALGAVDSFHLEGDRLVLSGAERDLVFKPDAPAMADELVGETWLLVEFSDAGESFRADGTGAHLLLNADGTLEGGTGCRSLNGTWIENGAEILFPTFGAEGECSEQLTRQDSQVTTVLGDGFRPELLGDKLFLTSAGNEQLFYVRSFDGEVPGEPTSEDEVGFPFDESLTWSGILVEADDVLNVRSAPGVDNEIVGELEPYETGVTAGTELVDVDGGRWRQIHTPSIPGGWVNEQYLTAQPAGAWEEGEVLGLAAAVLLEMGFSRPASEPYPISTFFSPTGVWIGGIGVFGDFPFPARRVPAVDLGDEEGWRTPVDFTPDEMDDFDQDCPDCVISPLDFIRFPDPDREHEMLVDQDLLADQGLAGPTFLYGPVADLHNMHHVTIDVPASSPGDLDWQRIHLFFDWRTGEPLLHAVYTWGWTP